MMASSSIDTRVLVDDAIKLAYRYETQRIRYTLSCLYFHISVGSPLFAYLFILYIST